MSTYYQNRPEQCSFYLSINNTYKEHLHRQAELLIVLEGSLSVSVDQTSYCLSAEDGILVFPNQPHSLFTSEYSRILLCIFDIEFCPGCRNFLQDHLPVCPTFNRNLLPMHYGNGFMGLYSLASNRPKTLPASTKELTLAQGYLTLILACILDSMEWRTDLPPRDLKLEQKVLLYMDSHYLEALTLEHLAKEFGISRYGISRLFSEKLHTTFPNYLNTKRLEYAALLLRTTPMPVTHIALDTGFGSTRTFFREFHKRYQQTPISYRRANETPQPKPRTQIATKK